MVNLLRLVPDLSLLSVGPKPIGSGTPIVEVNKL